MKVNNGIIKAMLLGVFPFMLSSCRSPSMVEQSVAEQYFHRYGFEMSKEEFCAKGSSGKVVSHLRDGRVETSEFIEGRLEGVKSISYPYSDIIEKSYEYRDGQLLAEINHYKNGAPKERRDFDASTTKVLAWYPNGSPQAKESWEGQELKEATYYDDRHEVLAQVVDGNGNRLEFDLYGRICTKEQYQDGWVTYRETYYPNGALKSNVSYKANMPEGLANYYDLQGKILRKENWKDGHLHGEVIEFEDERPVIVHSYVYGRKDGIESRYRGDELVETWEWRDGKRHGDHHIYVDGVLVRTEYFYEDVMVSKHVFNQRKLEDN